MTIPLGSLHESAGALLVDIGPDRIVVRYRDPELERADAQTQGVRIDRSSSPRFRISGQDHRDFLHRMSTNEIASLSAGQGTVTLFLERTGRLVDRLAVLDHGDEMTLLGSRGRAAAVRDWVEKYVIAEDVRIEERTSETFFFVATGPLAGEALAEGLGHDPRSLPRWGHVGTQVGGEIVTLVRAAALASPTFFVTGPAEAAVATWEALQALPAAGEETLRALEVAAGVPAFGEDYTDRTIPLEAGMQDAISFTKGCYLGQEVIARVHNYKRVKRSLVRLAIEARALPTDDARVCDGEREIGQITSAVLAGERVLALASILAGFEAPGLELSVHDGTAVTRAEVLPPFSGDDDDPRD